MWNMSMRFKLNKTKKNAKLLSAKIYVAQVVSPLFISLIKKVITCQK